MTVEGENQVPGEGSIAEVDRIRDIIFGPQMRLYEQQFRRVVSQLDQLSNQLEALKADLDKQGAAQEALTRQVEANLAQQLAELRAESRQSVEALRDEQQSQLAAKAGELKGESRQLSADLRKQGLDLRNDFTTALDALADEKTGRQDLGDLLEEMGTRLKQQVGVADLLGQLGSLADSEAPD